MTDTATRTVPPRPPNYSSTDSAETLIHHGVMFSHCSAKTRAYLSFKRIPFVVRDDGRDIAKRLNPIVHKRIIPMVETPQGEILQDTTVTIDTLEQRFASRPVVPTTTVLFMVSRIVEFILDEFWIATAMNSRRNDPDSKQLVIREYGHRICGSSVFAGWKLQRAQAVFRDLGAQDRLRAEKLLSGIGWLDVMSTTPNYVLERKDYQTCLA